MLELFLRDVVTEFAIGVSGVPLGRAIGDLMHGYLNIFSIVAIGRKGVSGCSGSAVNPYFR
jgi:hypothetical protein